VKERALQANMAGTIWLTEGVHWWFYAERFYDGLTPGHSGLNLKEHLCKRGKCKKPKRICRSGSNARKTLARKTLLGTNTLAVVLSRAAFEQLVGHGTKR
jgi:hypothetical protein